MNLKDLWDSEKIPSEFSGDSEGFLPVKWQEIFTVIHPSIVKSNSPLMDWTSRQNYPKSRCCCRCVENLCQTLWGKWSHFWSSAEVQNRIIQECEFWQSCWDVIWCTAGGDSLMSWRTLRWWLALNVSQKFQLFSFFSVFQPKMVFRLKWYFAWACSEKNSNSRIWEWRS